MKLLIVDDNREFAESLKKILTLRMEYLDRCEIVGNLKDALLLSKTMEPGVTLLDLDLPGSTIDEVIESIPEFYPPVVVLTNHDSDAIILKCFQYNAQNVMDKKTLTDRIDGFDGKIQADRLIVSITNAHFRHELPKTRDVR